MATKPKGSTRQTNSTKTKALDGRTKAAKIMKINSPARKKK